ncbi:MAG TPA: 4-hydroxythreonine-4-phosphate dehydrogenase PdxA, partial [Candidatus Methylacidiphilales bacterium]
DPGLPKGVRFEVLGKEKGAGIQLGKLTPAGSRATLKALHEAAQGCLDGRFAAMVTGPVHKLALSRIDPDFVGQTEFLARACDLPDERAVMCLTDPKLTVALCSNHCSLRDAIKKLSVKRILYVTKITRQFLQQSGIAQPRVAFAGINPHLGEGNLFGDEDMRILVPAAQKLREEKIHLHFAPADTIFYYAVQKKAFDAVICAYHDQGLIPFKLVAFQTGVNVTLGLPLIRTSPDHGTALEIAGQGKADHRSMLAAVKLACRLVRAKS